jgi:hypothetical protein
VDRRAARAGSESSLAQDRHRLALAQGRFERTQLGVYVAQRAELAQHELVVSLVEAMQVEHEPAEVAVGELAYLAQEADAAAQAAARREAGWRVRRRGSGRLARAGRLCDGCLMRRCR